MTTAKPPGPTLTPSHCVFVHYVPDVAARREPHRASHLARLYDLYASGIVAAVGAWADEPAGALLLLRVSEDEAAHRLLRADPYFQAGLIRSYDVRPFNLLEPVPVPEGGRLSTESEE